MQEQLLFDIDMDPKSLLAGYSQRGFVFLTPKQVCEITGKTWGMIRYAAYNYALDAYTVEGNLRFTVGAVMDYLDGVQESFEENFRYTMSRLEVYGAYALRDGIVQPVIASLKSHGHSLTAIDTLLDIEIPKRYADQPQGSTDQEDFYGIGLLDLPDRMAVWELAELMQLPIDLVSRSMGCKASDIVDYPEVYDFLMSKQLVNVSIADKQASSQSSDSLSGQLTLDF